MADPLLNEILRRAVFAQAVQGLPTGFAPQPITFAPLAQQTPAMAMQAGGVAGAQDMVMADSRDGGSPGSTYGATGYSATGEPLTSFNTPFGPITTGDIAGKLVDVALPGLFTLASRAMTGRTPGQALKAAMTPVSEASIAMSPAAFDLAQQIGITPAEAQGMINAMGGSGAVAGQDLGAVAAQSLGFDTGMGTSYGAVGGDGGGGGGYGGYGGDTGGADTGGFGGVY